MGWGEDVCASYYVRGLGVEEGEEGTQRQEANQPHNAMDDVSHFLLNCTLLLLTFGPDHICRHISYCLLCPVNVSTHFAPVCFWLSFYYHNMWQMHILNVQMSSSVTLSLIASIMLSLYEMAASLMAPYSCHLRRVSLDLWVSHVDCTQTRQTLGLGVRSRAT